jgi:EpsI family protein
MTRRTWFVTALLLVFWAWLNAAAKPMAPPNRTSLRELPLEIAGWQGRNAPALEARVLEILGADDYIVRTYSDAARASVVGLYIGYHNTQRQDASIHSPMSCLPGAGWIPVRADRVDVTSGGRTATVNRVLVQKGEEQQLALYWYQSQGRIVASEYMGKAYLFLDAIRSGRTDAGLVRIMSPVSAGQEAAAQQAAVTFAGALLPTLDPYLPN